MRPWSAERVLALAPDAAAQRSARGLATPAAWPRRGCAEEPPVVWGQCRGSAAQPYEVGVDLTGPAYRCTCPSRKVPCKHALALLLLWSAGTVEAQPPPAWLHAWLTERAERAERTERAAGGAAPAEQRPQRTEPGPAALRRAARVAAGVDELDRWLGDQVRQGLAGATRAGYGHWDAMAARLVDAQAPGLASAVRRLAGVAATPDRLLGELALIRLLAVAYRRIDQLPAPLAATVRSRVGFPVATEAVLAGPRLRDDWAVIGVREEADERLSVRRVWLSGQGGRPALVLSFAAPGQSLPADLPLSTSIDAELCFYPGAQPLRALVAQRHGEPLPVRDPPGAGPVAAALAGYAAALSAEPWLERWPMLLAAVVPMADGAGRWHLRDVAGDALPLDPALGPPWWLVAFCGGAPATVAAEWGVAGLRPLTAWAEGRVAGA